MVTYYLCLHSLRHRPEKDGFAGVLAIAFITEEESHSKSSPCHDSIISVLLSQKLAVRKELFSHDMESWVSTYTAR